MMISTRGLGSLVRYEKERKSWKRREEWRVLCLTTALAVRRITTPEELQYSASGVGAGGSCWNNVKYIDII